MYAVKRARCLAMRSSEAVHAAHVMREVKQRMRANEANEGGVAQTNGDGDQNLLSPPIRLRRGEQALHGARDEVVIDAVVHVRGGGDELPIELIAYFFPDAVHGGQLVLAF